MLQKISNEKEDDFALKIVPESARKWRNISLFNVLLGISTTMLLFLYGGIAVKEFGMSNLLTGMIIIAIISGTIGFLLIFVASETGLDIDLITSSTLGYKAAAITSLIYGISYIIYFALEASIISESIHSIFSFIPISTLYILISFIFILLTWYGITIINQIMWISLPICLIGFLWISHLANNMSSQFNIFKIQTTPVLINAPLLLQLILMFLGPAIAGPLALADIGRFIPKKGNLSASFIMGYSIAIIGYLGTCLLGAWISSKVNQIDPGIYLPLLLGGFGTLTVVISQMRINTINVYSGSLAFSTFFSRSIGFTPGRQYFGVFLILCSLILMFFDIIKHVNSIFILLSIFLASWTTVVITDILFNKRLFKVIANNFPIERGEIPDYNPIGLIPLIIATVIGVSLSFGILGPLYSTLAPLISAAIALVLVILISLIKNNFH